MNTYWVAYDLGFGADYNRLFELLDYLEAVECTPSVARFRSKMDVDAMSSQIKELLSFEEKARVYLIYVTSEGKTKGRWVLGKRKPAPWAGFNLKDADGDEDYDD